MNKEYIEQCWRELETDPKNLKKAWNYWNSLGNYYGADIRSGQFLIKTFRESALSSKEGVVALVKAYKELLNLSGELPRRMYFDDELLSAIKEKSKSLTMKKSC